MKLSEPCEKLMAVSCSRLTGTVRPTRPEYGRNRCRANPARRGTGPPAEPLCTSRIEHDAAMAENRPCQVKL